MWLEFLILLLLILLLFYRWATINNDFFKKRNIPYDKPAFLMGSFADVVRKKTNFYELVINLYKKHNGKIYGVFDNRQPLYLIRDPELIKQITIVDFDHFVNHRNVFLKDDTKDSDLFGSSLIFLKNAKWRDMRNTLTPAFTGSKLRQTFLLMNQVAQQACVYLKEEIATSGESIELDVKEFAKRFTSDIIATVAFGVQVDSFKDKTNEFYVMGKEMTTFTFWQNIKYVLHTNFGALCKALNITFFDKKHTNYFMDLVLNTIKYRHSHHVIRHDMINMLMEARGLVRDTTSISSKAPLREWNDIEMVAQCLLFFFAGFETVAATISFTAHELMNNPNIQDKLYEEIIQVSNDLGEEPVTYDVLKKMPYLDMVISEVFRKWPGTLAVDRVCNKDITYDLGHGEKLSIKEGEAVWLPINALQMDEKYWQNPEEFNPERFSEDNKTKITPFTYVPFGFGQRNCIGSRLAILEVKTLIFYLVRDFHIEASPKTCKPFRLDTKLFEVQPEGGFWLGFKARYRS